jgi:hypothetical protein
MPDDGRSGPDSHAGQGNGHGHTHAAAPTLRAEDVGATMMRQLTDLLSDWERMALLLAERGVDPRPLLVELARNLRAVADQLDGG